jgi:DNA-binding PadR family transcriptional regulator
VPFYWCCGSHWKAANGHGRVPPMCSMPIARQNSCPCQGSTLTRLLRPALLTVLAGKKIHGYAVVRSLGSMRMFAQSPPDHSCIYRALKAMEAEDLVRSDWDESSRGPARHVFRITEAGRLCLANWRATLEAYSDALSEMLHKMHEGAKRERRGTEAAGLDHIKPAAHRVRGDRRACCHSASK